MSHLLENDSDGLAPEYLLLLAMQWHASQTICQLKRKLKTTQILGNAWAVHRIVTTDMDQPAVENEEGPFLEISDPAHDSLDKNILAPGGIIKTLIIHIIFFFNFASLLACSPNRNDVRANQNLVQKLTVTLGWHSSKLVNSSETTTAEKIRATPKRYAVAGSNFIA